MEPWLDQLYRALVNWFGIPTENLKKLLEDNSGQGMSDNEGGGNEERIKHEAPVEEEDDEIVVPPKILKPSPVDWPKDKACLTKGKEGLGADQDLRVPVASTTYLAAYFTHEKFDESTVKWQNGCKLIGAASDIFTARVVGVVELTDADAVKPKKEIQLDIGASADYLKYEPGDAFYFISPNPVDEVNFILERMNLLTVADQKFVVALNPKTERQNAARPDYIPETSSLRYLLTYCLDIRRSPSRPLLRILANCTKDESEKRRLLELCSAQGVDEFTTFVRQAGISLVDLLFAFPSCRPSPERLIELLPRLQPRPYSVACSSLRWGKRIRFVYSLMKFPVSDGRCYSRYGLASGWLASLNVGEQIKIMLKEPARFRLPPPQVNSADVRRIPLILVGPGTGLAPFLSFLEHIYEKSIEIGDFVKVERELYFGCRQMDRDCIYGAKMKDFVRTGILTHLSLSESQPLSESAVAETSKYVQDALEKRGKQVTDLLMIAPTDGNEPARVFVCGDAKGMAKDVWNAFIRIISEHTGKTESEAKSFLEQLKKEDRYVEDVWS